MGEPCSTSYIFIEISKVKVRELNFDGLLEFEEDDQVP